MTISTTSRKAGPFIGNGATTVFAFSFKVFAATDLVVTQLDSSGAETVFVKDVHYSVALNANQETNPGGTITCPLSGSPLASPQRLTITCAAVETQPTDLIAGGGWVPDTVEARLDYLTALVQQHSEKLSRAPLTAVSDLSPLTLNIPVVASRVGRFLSFDASGNPIVSAGTGNDSALRSDLASTTIGNTLVAYKKTAAETIAGVAIVNAYYAPYVVDRYGTNTTPGTTDMTAAINAAISAARAAGGSGCIYLLNATYLITSTLVLASNTLAPVDILGVRPMWYGTTQGSTILCNMNSIMFNVGGSDSSHFSTAPQIENVAAQNTNAGASAIMIECQYSGGLRLVNSQFTHRNIGLHATTEGISVRLYEAIFACDVGVSVANIQGFFRNLVCMGGRNYSAQYALDISGDDPVFGGTNFEFCQVVFRHGSLSNATFIGCHIETSQCLLTNAITVPINLGGAWVDNASQGTGISGAVVFIGGIIALTNTNTNLVTIKTQGGFTYFLRFLGTSISASNSMIGNSFAPATGVALPSGTKIVVDITGQVNIQKPPADSFSGYHLFNGTSDGSTDLSGLKIGGFEVINSYRRASYTPTWVSTGTQPVVGNGSVTGSYVQIGKMVFFNAILQMGSTTTLGTGNYSFTLPVAPLLNNVPMGACYCIRQGVGTKTGTAMLTGSAAVLFSDDGTTVNWNATTPFTFVPASGDYISVSGCYIAA